MVPWSRRCFEGLCSSPRGLRSPRSALAPPAPPLSRVRSPGRVGHVRPKVLLVHLSDDVAPGGGHVWKDPAGLWRLRIEGEAATVLSAPDDYADGHPVLHAVAMP
ncbi:DUF6296 family protein [Kitasatospora sp. NPDC004745]|uniref:DUF6296 family protein n=1 Tax=Kitasatospora sp. NPDC004745 TaxID=3364019 RepID=UPI003683CCD2